MDFFPKINLIKQEFSVYIEKCHLKDLRREISSSYERVKYQVCRETIRVKQVSGCRSIPYHGSSLSL